MSILLKFTIGHNVKVRPIQTVNGHTHDWELFVQGVNGADISLLVQKIVVNLHPTFYNPKRILTEPPFVVRESGYEGFQLTMDFYFHYETRCRRVSYNYDLRLDIQSEIVTKQHVFEDCSEDLRKMLLAIGGIPVQAVNPFLKYSEGIDQVTPLDKSTSRFDPLQEKTKDDAPKSKAIKRVLSSIENDVKVENQRQQDKQAPRHRSKNKRSSRRYLNPEEEFKAAFGESILLSHSKSVPKRKAESSEDNFGSVACSNNGTNGLNGGKEKKLKLDIKEEKKHSMSATYGNTSDAQYHGNNEKPNQHMTSRRGINVNNGDLFEKILHSGQQQQKLSFSKYTANNTMTNERHKTEMKTTTSHIQKEDQSKRMSLNGDKKMTNRYEETNHRNGKTCSKKADKYSDCRKDMKRHDRKESLQCKPSPSAAALQAINKENRPPCPKNPNSHRGSFHTSSRDSGVAITVPKSKLDYTNAALKIPANDFFPAHPYYSNTGRNIEGVNHVPLEDLSILRPLQLKKQDSKLSHRQLPSSKQSKPPTSEEDKYKNQNYKRSYTPPPIQQIVVNDGRTSIKPEKEHVPFNNVEEPRLSVSDDSLDNRHIATCQYSQADTDQPRSEHPRRDIRQRFGSDEEYINSIPAPCLSDDDSDCEMLTSLTEGNEKPSKHCDSLPKGNKYQQIDSGCPTSRLIKPGCPSVPSSGSSSSSSPGWKSNTTPTSSDDDERYDVYYVQRRHPATVSDHLFTKVHVPSHNVEEPFLSASDDNLDNKHIATCQYLHADTDQPRSVHLRRDIQRRFGSDEEYINSIPAPCLSDDDSDCEMLPSLTEDNEKPSKHCDSLPKGNKYQQIYSGCPTSHPTKPGCPSAPYSSSFSSSSSGSKSNSTSTSSPGSSSDDDERYDVYYVHRRHPATVSDHLFTKILLFVRQGLSTLMNTTKLRQIIDRLSGTNCLKVDSRDFEIDLALIDWTDLVAVHDIIDGE